MDKEKSKKIQIEMVKRLDELILQKKLTRAEVERKANLGNGTRIANQFIVEVDIKNKRFLVFSSKNPKGYKKFYLSFDYLNNLGKVDGDDTVLKIVTPRENTKNQLLKEFDFS